MTEFFRVSDAPGEVPEALVVNPERLAESELPEGVEPNKIILTPLDEAGREAQRKKIGAKGYVGQKPGVDVYSPTVDVRNWRDFSALGQVPIGVVTLRGARRRGH